MNPNPFLLLTFAGSDKLQPNQLRLRLKNVSPDQILAYKIKTSVANLEHFVVSPNSSCVQVNSTSTVIVTCKTPEDFESQQVKFLVASQMIDPPIQPNLTFGLTNSFIVSYNRKDGLLAMASRSLPNRQRIGSIALGGSGGFPVIPQSFIKPSPVLADRANVKTVPVNGGGDSATIMKVRFGEESTLLDNDRNSKRKEPSGSAFRRISCRSALTTICFIVLGHIALDVFYLQTTWNMHLNEAILHLWRSISQIFFTLLEDPEEIVVKEESKSGIFIDMKPLGDSFCCLLWMLAPGIFFVTLLGGKWKLFYLWFMLMLLSYITTASTWFEIWDLIPDVTQNGPGWNFLVYTILLVVGTGTVMILQKNQSL